MAASAITCTPDNNTRAIINESGDRTMRASFVLASGNYVTTGIPMPTANGCGFPRALNQVIIEGSSMGSAYIFAWDRTNSTLRMFFPLAARLVSTSTGAIGWPASELTTGDNIPVGGLTLTVQLWGK